MRRYCRKHGLPFTTSFHTRFPEYVSARLPIPESWIWAALRRFHGASQAVMAATPALADELRGRGFRNVVLWPRGVDAICSIRATSISACRARCFCVGRVAVEKNLEAFLDLDLPGTKLIVGDGPARAALERKYPQAVFLGARQGEDLAEAYAAADVFVFPSRTDTFGLVLLEALASGLPVAAFPVTGPRDVIGTAAGRRPERGFAHRLPAGAEYFPAGLPAFAENQPGKLRPAPLSTRCRDAAARPAAGRIRTKHPHFVA